jgi:hypothetical protein
MKDFFMQAAGGRAFLVRATCARAPPMEKILGIFMRDLSVFFRNTGCFVFEHHDVGFVLA